MLAFLSQKIKIKNVKAGAFVFSTLFVLSFGVYSFADTQSASSKNIFQDADQDGLSNDEEVLYKTDPNNSDTDGDGYSDGAEVKGGYDPTKASPGDKLATIEDIEERKNEAILVGNKDALGKVNLTDEVSAQVAATLKESVDSKKELSLDELRDTIEKTMTAKISTDTLPEIDEKSIKIQKQKYSSLSEADRAAKIKEDTINYTTAVSYILVNNSPVQMQSDVDMQKLASFMMTNSMGMLSGGNNALLDDFSQKGKLITEQLSSVVVPENMLDIHMKALRLAQYTTTFKDNIQSAGGNDPLAQISSLAKVQGFMGLFSELTTDMQASLRESGVEASPL